MKNMKSTPKAMKASMKSYDDDPKKKKKKLFQSSESPSIGQRTAQGPFIGALSGLVTTGVAALMNRKTKAPKPEKLEKLSEEQQNRANKKTNKANRIEAKRPVRAAVLRAKAGVLSKKSEANKKAASELKPKK